MDRREFFELLFAYLMVSFALAAVLKRDEWLSAPFTREAFASLLEPFVLSLFTVGVGFTVHELAHRTVARYLGVPAFFRASYLGLALSVIMGVLFGVVFVVPGATVTGTLGVQETAIVAAAGPASNLALVPVFLFVSKFSPVGEFGVFVNATFAFFNSLPIIGLDGHYVLRGSKLLWALLFAFSSFLFVAVLSSKGLVSWWW